jgi:hypothetical protein
VTKITKESKPPFLRVLQTWFLACNHQADSALSRDGAFSFSLSVAEEVYSAHESLNYSEAILSVDREKWMGAMHEEMESLEKNDTWDVVHLPLKKKLLSASGFSREKKA